MKAEHTPGPFVAFSNDDPGIVQYVDDLEYHRERVADVTAGNCSFTYVPLSQAKAAPELLAALERIMNAVDHGTVKMRSELGMQASAAIAKARGE